MIAANNAPELHAHRERHIDTTGSGTVVPSLAAKEALDKARNLLNHLLAFNGNNETRRNARQISVELSELESRMTEEAPQSALLIIAGSAHKLATRVESLLTQSLDA